MHRLVQRASLLALVAALGLAPGSASADPPAPASAAADTAAAPPPPADTLKALEQKVRDLTASEDYREGALALDELLAQPGGKMNPVSQAFLLMHYGDFLRAESLILPIASKKEFRQWGMVEAAPLYLGTLSFYTGDRDAAEPRLREVIDQFDPKFRLAGLAPPLLWYPTLDLLAELYRERGQHRLAAQTISEMQRLFRERGGGARYEIVPDLHQAELALAKGDPVAAETALKAAQAIADASGDRLKRPGRARLLDAKGVLASRRGDFTNAEVALKEALALRTSVFHPTHPLILKTLRHLSDIYVESGRIDDAVATSARAADLGDRRAQALLGLGSERRKRAATEDLRRDTDAVLSLHLQSALKSPAAARLALTVVLRRKGIVLEAIAGGLSAVHKSLDEKGKALSQELVTLDARLSTMVSRGPVDVTLDDFEADLNELEEKRRALEERLAAHARTLPSASAIEEKLLDIDSVRAAIPEGAALVEIVEYRPYYAFGPPVRPTFGTARYAAYILRRTGDLGWVDLGKAAPINVAASRLADRLASNEDATTQARALDALVMAPIRTALGSVRWILLSPDGALSFVPFYALRDESGRELIETTSFTYVLSGRDLLRRSETPAAPRQEALVVADPEFGRALDAAPSEAVASASRAVDLAQVFFSRLRGTQEEGHSVRTALPGSSLLAGPSATEEAIKAARGPKVLHIATHGFFLPDTPREAKGDRGATMNPAPWNENPLLRAGLALYGANQRRSTTDANDGVLTALEVSDLDLRGTRLVVLSACETGVGEVSRGEGVYGLQRALMIAGAETQVMSLWQVDDRATKELMIRYYQELARGGGRSEGLRTAQLEMRAKRPNPYYWASFIVAGNGASLDGDVVPPTLKNFEVPKSPRGCACEAAGAEDARGGLFAGLFAAVFAALRRRRCRSNAPPG